MKRVKRIGFAAGLAAITFIGCQQALAECGVASTYWEGSRTANGEHYNPAGISAAHKSLPFGTRVLVRDQHTGRSIVVRINDRGPYVGGRIIDLSTGAKKALGMDGLAPVCISVVSPGNGARVVEAAYHPRHVHRARFAQVRNHHRYAGLRHPHFRNAVLHPYSHATRRRGRIA
jgi:rare lipoprotein A